MSFLKHVREKKETDYPANILKQHEKSHASTNNVLCTEFSFYSKCHGKDFGLLQFSNLIDKYFPVYSRILHLSPIINIELLGPSHYWYTRYITKCAKM